MMLHFEKDSTQLTFNDRSDTEKMLSEHSNFPHIERNFDAGRIFCLLCTGIYNPL